MNTLHYYDENAASFSAGIKDVEFGDIQRAFTSCLKAGSTILDFGCGSGRDTRAFLGQGFSVDALDGSKELCALASEYTGIPVRQILFQDFRAEKCYDGIWACASLLHLTKPEIRDVMTRLRDALKPDGILYCSFKYGDFEGERNGRYFTDLTEESFSELTRGISGLTAERMWITGDAREDRNSERWLNVLLKLSS